MTSTNNMITHIAGMGRNGAHSILGGNLRYLDSKYSLDCKKIVSRWLMMEPMNVVIKVNQIKVYNFFHLGTNEIQMTPLRTESKSNCTYYSYLYFEVSS